MVRSTVAALALLVALAPGVGLGQEDAALTGVVTDATTNKPLSDVVVRARGALPAGLQVVRTDATGTFLLLQLRPGRYELSFERATHQALPRPGVEARAGATTRLDVALLANDVTAPQTPAGSEPAPSVDVGSARQAVSLTRDFLERVPFVAPSVAGVRTFEDLARAAPHAVEDRSGFGLNGSQASESLYVVDGLQVNDPATGLLRAGRLGGALVPLEFLEEASVITGGLSPAFGRGTGGVVTAETKSGTNVTRGSVWGSWWPGALTARGQTLRREGSSVELDARRHNTGDFGADVGGALVKDRLWFYAAVAQGVDRQRVTRGLRRFLLTDDRQDFLLDDSGSLRTERLAEASAFDDRRSLSWLAKLTLRAAPTQTLSLSAFGSPQERAEPGLGPSGQGGARSTSNVTTTSLRYSGSFFERHLVVDATVGWSRTEQARLPSDGSRPGATEGLAGVPQTTFRGDRPLSLLEFEALPEGLSGLCEPAGFSATRRVDSRGTSRFVMACPVTGSDAAFSIGGPGLLEESLADRLQARGSVALRFQALGHHVARAGVDLDWTQAQFTRARSGGVSLTGTGAVGAPLDAEADAFLAGPGQLVPLLVVRSAASQLSTGAFLQDSWRFADAVTLNAGLRYERQQLFAAPGQPSLSLQTLSPRVGLVYDFTRRGRSRLFANYAVQHQALPLQLADRALNGEWRTRTRTTCDPVADPEGARVACADPANALPLDADPLAPSQAVARLAAGPLAVDPALQAMTRGELSAGLEYEVVPNLRVGLVGTHAWLLRAVEDVSTDEGATRLLANPGAGLASGLPPAERRFFSGTLFASRAFTDGWLLQASYTLSSLTGTWSGFLRPVTGLLSPGLT
ncbi:MAG: TonB-dependent receptor, partial [Myxococcaceae bacterium]|nr:TonB-dependent receptor [Myxococcaceae bacterium]